MLTEQLRQILADSLEVPALSETLEDFTPLLGAVPELDSIAVLNVISSLEEVFDIQIADDEIDASIFETFGSVVAFVRSKVDSR